MNRKLRDYRVSMSASELQSLIDRRPVSGLQIAVVVICLLMNIVDGMDVLVISYAAPALAKAWEIGPQALGGVFSAGVLGMTAGAVTLAPAADRWGRRPMILACIIVISASVLTTAAAESVSQLVVLRFVSGLGIGAMLATVAAMVAEYAPERSRNFFVGLVLAGYPIGATIAGLIAAEVIPVYGWRTMFLVAGAISAATLPVAAVLLPESASFLVQRQPRNALERINKILLKMGLPAQETLPQAPTKQPKVGLRPLLASEWRRETLKLWLAFLMSFGTLYFLISWIPKLASGAGLSMELAIMAGTVFNLGAVFGIVCQGALATRFDLRAVIAGFLLITALLMLVFGWFTESATALLLFGLIGFGVQGGFTGLYTVAARLYPTALRSSGIGWGIGAGRVGAVLGPAAGGALIALGLNMIDNFRVFAVPLVVAAMATLAINRKGLAAEQPADGLSPGGDS
jgi:benzoate transport